MVPFNPLEHQICFASPLRLAESAWIQHVPFGMFLVDMIRPKVIVELGAFTGVSYCAFCQAVKALEIETHCYAVDTWQGDAHAGFYGPELFQELKEHHDPLYGSFSRLVQSTFDEALQHFEEASIDLLHIDGFHTYEAAHSDFHKWLPKMSRRGVVILHDINVRERQFGLWKLWEELKVNYPHFAFLHGHGLGILGVGPQQLEPMQALFGVREVETIVIREFFYLLGARIEKIMEETKTSETLKQISQLKAETRNAQEYINRVQQLWSVRLFQVWSNEGFSGFIKKGLSRIKAGIFPPPWKDWW
jgi:O-antigen biosynthesis protein